MAPDRPVSPAAIAPGPSPVRDAGAGPVRRRRPGYAPRLVLRDGRRYAAAGIAAGRAAAEEGVPRHLDPFADDYGSGEVIRPLYDLADLARMPEVSDVVLACCEAMATNVGGHGVSLLPAEGVEFPGAIEEGAEDAIDSSAEDAAEQLAAITEAWATWVAIEEERRRLLRWLRYPSAMDSLEALRWKLRIDLEATGNAYLEVVRSADADGITSIAIEHVPSHTMRIRGRAKIPVDLLRWERDPATGAWRQGTVRYRPISYVQHSTSSGDRVYFRELGDPRILDHKTGIFQGDAGSPGVVPVDRRATEVIHMRRYVSSRTPYGLPRYLPAAFAAAGRAEADEKNMDAIGSNGIPNMLLLAYGAEPDVIEATMSSIADKFQAMQDGDGRSDILIVPLAPKDADPLEAQRGDSVKGEIVKLNDLILQDALYLEYRRDAKTTVRSTFRLPPIVLGDSDDYNRATAETAWEIANSQVFRPEAVAEDRIYNDRLLPELGIRWWQIRTLTSTIHDESELSAVSTALSDAMGLTPRMAGELAERFLGVRPARSYAWDDLPVPVVRALLEQGLLLPPEDLQRALGIVGAEDEEAMVPPPENEGASRALRNRLTACYGARRAGRALAETERIVRILLAARERIEAMDVEGA